MKVLQSNIGLLLTVIIIVTLIMSIVIVAIPKMIKKGINVGKYIKTADDVLDTAGNIIKATDSIIPNNPVINVLKLIEKYAHIGVNEAEQLYLSSCLPKEDRNAKAKQTVYNVLRLMNISITPELQKIIDGTIEAECLALGHKDDNTKSIQIQLEKHNENLQQVNNSLKMENDELKNKISQIQSTVSI